MLTIVLDRFGAVDAFSAHDLPVAEPGPGEVRVAVRAVGFNPVDCSAREGALGGTPPMVLGRDLSGVIDAVGDAVGDADPGFAVGDAVYARANAAYAESIVVPAALVARMPAGLSFAEAAALPVAGLTALARERAGGYGVRAAFDFAGGAMKRLCFDAVAADGHVVSIVEEEATYPLNLWDERSSPLVLRSVSYHFVQLAAALRYGPRAGRRRYGRELGELARLVDAGALPAVPITDLGPFSLEAVRRAHRMLDAGGVRGKLVASVG